MKLTNTTTRVRNIYWMDVYEPMLVGREVTKEEFYALSTQQLRSAFTGEKETYIFANAKGDLTLQFFQNEDFFKVYEHKNQIYARLLNSQYELSEEDIDALSADEMRAAILNSPLYDIKYGTDGELYVIPLDQPCYGIESDNGIKWGGLERTFDR